MHHFRWLTPLVFALSHAPAAEHPPKRVLWLEPRHVARLQAMQSEGLFEGTHLGVLLSSIALLVWGCGRLNWG